MGGRVRRGLVVGVLVAGGVATGTSVLSVATPAPAQAGELSAFAGCDELRTWYVDAALPQVGPYGLSGGPAVYAAAAGRIERQAVPAADTATAAGNGATGTNVQEAGVDEPDTTKTDGRRLVTVGPRGLAVVDVTGRSPRVLGRLRLPGAESAQLLLVPGNRAVVLSARYDVSAPPLDPRGVIDRELAPRDAGATTVTLVDLSDPGAPTVVRSDEVDGGLVSARMYGGVVRLVLSHRPDLPFTSPELELARTGTDPSSPEAGPKAWAAAERRATRANRAVVRNAAVQQWLPQRVARQGSTGVASRRPLLDCTDVRHPREATTLATVSVLTVDPVDGIAAHPTAVTSDGETVYASPTRLYVATTSWQVQAASRAVSPAVPERVRTYLHAFDVSAPDRTSYVATGNVEGGILGQWALSEHEGLLRVAATRSGTGPAGGASDAEVTVLRERGTRLVEVGSVAGLGRTETIRAVRWFGDLAVVVTFHQTDPLYTVDLSDPAAPRVRGELKVPGYSAYLHPVGGHRILGVGQDADARTGQTFGAQVSTFDLRRLDRPARLDTRSLGHGSTSPVEHDSRAFAYVPSRGLAVVPVFDSGWRSSLQALHVDGSGRLTRKGSWTAPAEAQIRRAVPVGEDRIAVVLHDRVVLLDLDGFAPSGSATL